MARRRSLTRPREVYVSNSALGRCGLGDDVLFAFREVIVAQAGRHGETNLTPFPQHIEVYIYLVIQFRDNG